MDAGPAPASAPRGSRSCRKGPPGNKIIQRTAGSRGVSVGAGETAVHPVQHPWDWKVQSPCAPAPTSMGQASGGGGISYSARVAPRVGVGMGVKFRKQIIRPHCSVYGGLCYLCLRNIHLKTKTPVDRKPHTRGKLSGTEAPSLLHLSGRSARFWKNFGTGVLLRPLSDDTSVPRSQSS